MALRLFASSAAKIVRQSSKLARSPGQQYLKYHMDSKTIKSLVSNSSRRVCSARCKLPCCKVSTTATAFAHEPANPEQHSQSVDTLPHDLDGLVGQSKAEIEAFHAGFSDPWEWDPIDHGYGTRKNPILVPTQLDERVVGCMCEGEDGSDATYLLLTFDNPIQRCGECGNVYKLVEGPIFQVPPMEGIEDHYNDDHHH